MKAPWSYFQGFPKMIVLSVSVLLVSGGMCGVQLIFGNEIYNGKVPGSGLLMLLGLTELLVMGAAALVLLFSLILWPISALLGQTKREDGQ